MKISNTIIPAQDYQFLYDGCSCHFRPGYQRCRCRKENSGSAVGRTRIVPPALPVNRDKFPEGEEKKTKAAFLNGEWLLIFFVDLGIK